MAFKTVPNPHMPGKLQLISSNDFSDNDKAKLDNIVNPMLYKGSISLALDFPTLALVQPGWTYTVAANVTDNNPAKTNTGLSFNSGDEIAWNGTTWINLGITTIDWSNVNNKPSSLVADIDDAVSKKHTQGTDTTLNPMTTDLDLNDHSIINLKDDSIGFKSGGEINRADYLDSISKKHTQNSDTKLNSGGSSEVSASELLQNIYNTVLLFFYRAIDNSLAWFEMVDGIVDEYEDQTGIDNIISENHVYNISGKYYTSEETLDA
jgi:hypothetical protein